ncbi:FAD:protein FMN transferase [Halorussus salinisoli]|uniref:FAD:protein FMN transferase n=1 Tax=Halorussus salinisoli TaxID=2558242 RepID=UPI0010C22409|nr:FAD:protein FMN transferase [Halorussus salinisoli]
MSLTSKIVSQRERRTRRFKCCDTTFELHVQGWKSDRAMNRAEETARTLERQLNAFNEDSAVAKLNRTGEVTNHHVARLVHRGLEYCDRTDGTFDIVNGRFEHDLKAYLQRDRDTPPDSFEPGEVRVSGSRVTADVPLDLNGLAKGYIVDRVYDTLTGLGRDGFVDGGGDIAHPTGAVGIESPYGDSKPLKTLDTRWNVATSAGYNRHRDGTDHIYNPGTERIGSRHDLVTVVAERDCMEADALATTLAVLPTDDALAQIAEWDGVEALVVHDGVFNPTEGFTEHVSEY